MKRFVSLVFLAMCVLAFASAAVVELNPDNFDKIVKDPSKNVFVMFYAPWCGHCNHMKPEWENLGNAYKEDGDVIIAKVDASEHRDIATKFDIKGFPTLKLFTKNNKKGIEYQGGARNLPSFQTFLREKVN